MNIYVQRLCLLCSYEPIWLKACEQYYQASGIPHWNTSIKNDACCTLCFVQLWLWGHAISANTDEAQHDENTSWRRIGHPKSVAPKKTLKLKMVHVFAALWSRAPSEVGCTKLNKTKRHYAKRIRKMQIASGSETSWSHQGFEMVGPPVLSIDQTSTYALNLVFRNRACKRTMRVLDFKLGMLAFFHNQLSLDSQRKLYWMKSSKKMTDAFEIF